MTDQLNINSLSNKFESLKVIISSILDISLDTSFGVKPKKGNREQYQGKHGKYQKKLGKQWVKHEET